MPSARQIWGRGFPIPNLSKSRYGRRVEVQPGRALGTKFYLHQAASTVGGTLPSSTALSVAAALGANFAGEAVNRSADQTIGASQQTASGSILTSKSALVRRFISAPLSAQTIPQGIWQMNLGVAISGAGPGFVSFGVYLWRPSTGTKITTIVDDGGTGIGGTSFTSGSEVAVTVNLTNFSFISAATAVDGDVLVFEVYIFNQNAGTQTGSAYYDGTTEGSASSNAATLFAPVELAFVSTTPVGASLAMPYTVNVAAGKSSAQPWTDYALVGKSDALPWTDYALAGKSDALPYTVNAILGKSLVEPWTDYAMLGKSLGLPWTDFALAGRSAVLPWTDYALAGASLAEPYTVYAQIGRSAALPYAVSAFVGRSGVLPYQVAALAGRSLTQPSLVNVLAGASAALPYGVAGAVGGSLAMPSSVLTTLGRSSTLSWADLALAGGSAALPYTLIAQVGRSTSLPYGVSALAGKSLSQPYSVIAFVGRSLGMPFTVSVLAGASLAQPWTIYALVGRSSATPYTMFAAIGRSLAQPYGVAGATGKSLVQPYVVLRIVGQQVIDTFNRVTSNGWGTAEQGGAWTVNAGVASEFSTDGALAKITTAVLNSSRFVTLAAPATVDIDIKARVALAAVPAGATSLISIPVRYVDVSNHYRAWLNWTTAGAVQLRIEKIVAGSITVFTTQPTVISGYTGGSFVWVRFQVVGNRLRAKAWADGSGEPTAWTVETTDPANAFPSAGRMGVRLFHSTGSTNNPTLSVDDLTVQTPVLLDTPYTVTVAVGKSLAQPSTDYALAGKSAALPYGMAGATGKSLGLPYQLRVMLGKSLAQPWGDLTLAGRSLALPSSMLAAVGASLGQPFKLFAFVSRALAQPYAVLVAVGRSNVLAYDTQAAVGASRALAYVVQTFAGRSLTTSYLVEELVGRSLVQTYEVVASVVPVGRSLLLRYQVLQASGSSLVLTWLVRPGLLYPVLVQFDRYETSAEFEPVGEVLEVERQATSVDLMLTGTSVEVDP